MNTDVLPDSFARRATAYYPNLNQPANLPPTVSALNPYTEPVVRQIVRQFYGRFFNDVRPRVFVLGINPGRFGAGLTGISFTSPQNLRRYCHIDHPLSDQSAGRSELSSRFIYQVIEGFGGAQAFYSHFFLTSLFPLALTKSGKNYNFYDDRITTDLLWPAIAEAVATQLAFGADRRTAICLGRKNEIYLHRLNDQFGFFGKIVTLDHPRYILQYKSRDTLRYLAQYLGVLHDCLNDPTKTNE